MKIKGIWNREKKYNFIISNSKFLKKMNNIIKFILSPILQDYRSQISLLELLLQVITHYLTNIKKILIKLKKVSSNQLKV